MHILPPVTSAHIGPTSWLDFPAQNDSTPVVQRASIPGTIISYVPFFFFSSENKCKK